MMDKFISEHLCNKDVEGLLRRRRRPAASRQVVGSADGVLVLENGGRRTCRNIEKVIAA